MAYSSWWRWVVVGRVECPGMPGVMGGSGEIPVDWVDTDTVAPLVPPVLPEGRQVLPSIPATYRGKP